MSAAAVQSPNTAPLTANDRCDRCGAAAHVRVELVTGGDLLFCGHHWREHEEKIVAKASHIHVGQGPV